MIDFIVSKYSYNPQTRRAAYVSRSFTNFDSAAIFFTKSRSKAEYKARKTVGYKATIQLLEKNGNLCREHKRTEIGPGIVQN